MTTAVEELEKLPELRHPSNEWATIFSSHPFEAVLDRAQGIYLYDEDGKRYIDASGGPIAINLGHGDPRLTEAVRQQMEKHSYCHPVFSSRPRAELCQRIARLAPGSLNQTYLVSGGSEAVETAIKIARQYQVLAGRPAKHRVISHHDSYHGMTLATLAVSGNAGTQRYFEPMLPKWPKIAQYSPYNKPSELSEDEWGYRCAERLEVALHHAGHHSVAAFLATPVGCGSDYGVVAPAVYWQTVREICDRYDVLLIADEVVTGFGRTGKWFGMEHFGTQADLMTTGKGISSLYAPLGAVTVSDEVAEPFEKRPFVHGFTNGGHPVACAVGCAVIDILESDGLIANSARVGTYLEDQLQRIRQHRTVADVRGRGLLRVCELVKDPETMEFFDRSEQAEHKFQALALKNGLAFYGTLYGAPRAPALRRGLPLFIMPPLCITEEQVDDLVERLDQTLTTWEEMLGIS